MEITSEDRQMMKNIIDFQIQNVYRVIDFGNNDKVKKAMGVTNSFDFILGMMYAKIIGSISDYLRTKMEIMGDPTPEQLEEITSAATEETLERLPELREVVRRHL